MTIEVLRGRVTALGRNLAEQASYSWGDPSRRTPDPHLPCEQRWAEAQGLSPLAQADFVLQEVIIRAINPSQTYVAYENPYRTVVDIPISGEDVRNSMLRPGTKEFILALAKPKSSTITLRAHTFRHLNGLGAPHFFGIALLANETGVGAWGEFQTEGLPGFFRFGRFGYVRTGWINKEHLAELIGKPKTARLAAATAAMRKHALEAGSFALAGELIGFADWKLSRREDSLAA